MCPIAKAASEPLNDEFGFLLAREDFDKTEKLWWAVATSFAELFKGNEAGFYWYDKGAKQEYVSEEGEAGPLDFMEHLFGFPNRHILSVPIRSDDHCFWSCIDPDRHLPDDPPIDWPKLARRITELHLPLVVCKSKGMKGANIFCFFKGKDGIPAADARRIMRHFAELLEFGNAEIFPKQDTLKTAKGFGSGVCLPYHHTRAFDAEGGEIESVTAFIEFCWERAVYGGVVLRDLPGETAAASLAPRAPVEVKSRPIKAAEARKQYDQNLVTLRETPVGGRGNDILFETACFAGNVLKALGRTEAQITSELLDIVTKEWKSPHPVTGAESTIESGLRTGISKPRDIVFPPTLEWMNSSQQIVIEKSPAIVNRLVYAATSTGLVAKPKVGKTTLLLDLSEAVNYGRPFLEEETMQGSVLYVSEQPLASFYAELLNSGLQTVGQMKLESNAPKGQFEFVTIEKWYKLSWTEIIEAVLARALEIGACLVIFDTLSRIARVENENDASEVQAAADELAPLLEAKVAYLLSQHERKSGGTIEDAGRGSGALAGTVDVLLRLTRTGGKFPGSYRTLEFIGRFSAPPERIINRETTDSQSRYTLIGDVPAVKAKNTAEAILAMFSGQDQGMEYTLDQIIEDIERKRTTTQNAIRELVKMGNLLEVGDGTKGDPKRYRLSDKYVQGWKEVEEKPPF